MLFAVLVTTSCVLLALQARRLLSKVGGEVVHVFSEEGMRISYRPYREMSAALMR